MRTEIGEVEKRAARVKGRYEDNFFSSCWRYLIQV
jgi:hypothetical protein